MTYQRKEVLAEGVTLTVEQARGLTRQQRVRLRKRGVIVPFVPQKSGHTQSLEHVAKRAEAIRGAKSPYWKGDAISRKGARKRALKAFAPQACADCGTERAERHHIDCNPKNNAPSNIKFLCRPCHIAEHRRLRNVEA